MSVSKKSVASCLPCRLVTNLIALFNDYIYIKLLTNAATPETSIEDKESDITIPYKISPVSVKGIRCLYLDIAEIMFIDLVVYGVFFKFGLR